MRSTGEHDRLRERAGSDKERDFYGKEKRSLH